MNPFSLLDDLLSEWASPRVRRTIHGLLALALVGVGIWQAADGDWAVALGSLVASLYAEANRTNTPSIDAYEEAYEEGYEDAAEESDYDEEGEVSGNPEPTKPPGDYFDGPVPFHDGTN